MTYDIILLAHTKHDIVYIISSAGASSTAAPTNMPSIDWHGSAQGSKAVSLCCFGSQPLRTSLSTNAGGSALGSSLPSCRPWERGDLLRRLATFKPSNWFAKPKVNTFPTLAQLLKYASNLYVLICNVLHKFHFLNPCIDEHYFG